MQSSSLGAFPMAVGRTSTYDIGNMAKATIQPLGVTASCVAMRQVHGCGSTAIRGAPRSTHGTQDLPDYG